MDDKLIISPKDSCRAAQMFNFGSIIAVLIAPLLMIWIAASIFVYASIAHHPNAKVAKYNQWAGYRFYGAAGAMMVFGTPIYHIFNDWHGLLAIWTIMFVVVVPAGILSIIKAYKEQWSVTQIAA